MLTLDGQPTTLQTGDMAVWIFTDQTISFFRPGHSGDALRTRSGDDKMICYSKSPQEVGAWLSVIAELSGLQEAIPTDYRKDLKDKQLYWQFV